MQLRTGYSSIDWDRIDHVRAQLHVHEPRNPIDPDSPTHDPVDASGLDAPKALDHHAPSPSLLIDKYRNAGYGVLAITEHEHVTPDDQHTAASSGTSWPWSRWDRSSRDSDMIGFEGAELRGSMAEIDGLHDIVSLDNSLAHGGRQPLLDVVNSIADRDGLAFLAHPTKYVEPSNPRPYYDLFATAPQTLIGVEIINAFDRYPGGAELWDGLLTTFGGDRPIWGLANDDYHARPRPDEPPRFDVARTVLLVETLSPSAVHDALQTGRSYVQMDGSDANAPPINRIDVTADTIGISASAVDTITWIADGDVVEDGREIRVETLETRNYVRAELQSGGAVTYTQPMYFS